MYLVDHTDPVWEAAYKAKPRENGAATYSRELVRFQVPVWQQELPDWDLTISTCPLLRSRPLPGGDLLVQYLHEWRYRMPERPAQDVYANARGRYKHVVFVTAYKPLAASLRACGLSAWWIPMSLDIEPLRAVQAPLRRRTDAVAYFGNLTRKKSNHFRDTSKNFPSQGFVLHHVKGRQPDVWRELINYQYGMGVGRCAMEMAALGMQVILDGAAWGGLVMDDADYERQQSVNFNGRLHTGAATVPDALKLVSRSKLWVPLDSRDAAETLRKEIHGRLLLRS